MVNVYHFLPAVSSVVCLLYNPALQDRVCITLPLTQAQAGKHKQMSDAGVAYQTTCGVHHPGRARPRCVRAIWKLGLVLHTLGHLSNGLAVVEDVVAGAIAVMACKHLNSILVVVLLKPPDHCVVTAGILLQRCVARLGHSLRGRAQVTGGAVDGHLVGSWWAADGH